MKKQQFCRWGTNFIARPQDIWTTSSTVNAGAWLGCSWSCLHRGIAFRGDGVASWVCPTWPWPSTAWTRRVGRSSRHGSRNWSMCAADVGAERWSMLSLSWGKHALTPKQGTCPWCLSSILHIIGIICYYGWLYHIICLSIGCYHWFYPLLLVLHKDQLYGYIPIYPLVEPPGSIVILNYN